MPGTFFFFFFLVISFYFPALRTIKRWSQASSFPFAPPRYDVSLIRAAVPFRRQTINTYNSSGMSPKRDCGPHSPQKGWFYLRHFFSGGRELTIQSDERLDSNGPLRDQVGASTKKKGARALFFFIYLPWRSG